MQKSTTSQERTFSRGPEITRPSEAYRQSPGVSGEVQNTSKNPVILALRRIEPSGLETNRPAIDKARITNEIIERLGWSNAASSNSSDGIAIRALRERRNREQVSRMRAELDAYLERSGQDEEREAPRREDVRREPLLRNSVLAASPDRRSSNHDAR